MLADETDFIDLYGKLRLEPDCSLADFKQAYRRHVSAWHPDRRSRGERADALAARRLQRLMAQYAAAMDFHKQHGRLPGAPPPKPERTADAPDATTPCRSALARDSFRPAATGPSTPREETSFASSLPQRVGVERRLLWGAAIVMAGVAVWAIVPEAERDEGAAEGVPVVVAEVAAPLQASTLLTVGMKDDEVAAIEGEPTLRSPDRWEYGPSWVRFEGGGVVDWYSSPLRSLHVRSTHPTR